jgi:hypothetical protein
VLFVISVPVDSQGNNSLQGVMARRPDAFLIIATADKFSNNGIVSHNCFLLLTAAVSSARQHAAPQCDSIGRRGEYIKTACVIQQVCNYQAGIAAWRPAAFIIIER